MYIFAIAGKDSELKGELVGHTGGIYGLAWDGSSKKILTASGDKTCRSAKRLLRSRGTIIDLVQLSDPFSELL